MLCCCRAVVVAFGAAVLNAGCAHSGAPAPNLAADVQRVAAAQAALVRLGQSAPTGEPSEADVTKLADDTRASIDAALGRVHREQTWLGLSLGAGNTLVKVGQFAGGGGAIVFGLNAANNAGGGSGKTSGRNAAYAGAVAAGVTALQELFGLDAKRAREAACKDLGVRKVQFDAQTQLWKYRASNAKFRTDTLAGEQQKLVQDVTDLSRKCIVGATP